MNNNIEKKIIPFSKPLGKKDIKLFLSSLSGNVSYDMSNIGDIIQGIDKSLQNECSGAIDYRGIKISYDIHIRVDNNVHHINLSHPPTTDKEILDALERKIAEFFSRYSAGTS